MRRANGGGRHDASVVGLLRGPCCSCAGAIRRGCAGVSGQAGADHRAARGRRTCRYPGARGGTAARRVVGPVFRRREPCGRGRGARRRGGSSGHMVAEQFKLLTGMDMVHVPYRGAAPAVQDLIAGHVHIMFDSVTLQMPHLTAGATRALAVLTPERVSVLPNVPTMAEAGY